MATDRPRILEQVATLAEEARCRILLVVEAQELTVTELCRVLGLPQSTVSRHLKLLGDHGWVARRREGTKSYYQLDSNRLAPRERRLWLLLRDSMSDSAASEADRRRLDRVLAGRRSRSAEFFSATAEGWDDLRRELFGMRFDLLGLLGLIDPDWCVGDLGCGTGELSLALAPFVDRLIAVDSSEAMLATARRRLARFGNVEVASGTLEQLPIPDRTLDAATLFLVLHHVAEPSRVIREAERALKPGGCLLIVDMESHHNEELRQQMGHVWLGFTEESIKRQLEESGFVQIQFQPLPEDPEAKGPGLFVARARTVSADFVTDTRKLSRAHGRAISSPRRILP